MDFDIKCLGSFFIFVNSIDGFTHNKCSITIVSAL